MFLPPKALYEILQQKGVTTLHHANSVATSTSFLKTGHLISRGTLERDGGLQTSQYSDKEDRFYDVWYDVFTDSVDIHDRKNDINFYGPVLFEIDSKILTSEKTGKIWISKLNPTKWSGKSYEERWFTSKTEVIDDFVHGTFDQMIIFRHCGGKLDIRKFLNRIVVDDPKIEWEIDGNKGIDTFSLAYGAISTAMAEGKLSVPIHRRKCYVNCKCIRTYQNQLESVEKMFMTKI